MSWLDTHLIPEWKSAWKFASVQLAGFIAALSAVAVANTSTLLSLIAYLPERGWARFGFCVLTFVLVFTVPAALRCWKQTPNG